MLNIKKSSLIGNFLFRDLKIIRKGIIIKMCTIKHPINIAIYLSHLIEYINSPSQVRPYNVYCSILILI